MTFMWYLVTYLAVGLLFASSALLHEQFARGKILIAFISMTMLWPLGVIAVPEAFLRRARSDADGAKLSDMPDDGPINWIQRIQDVDRSALSPDEMTRLSKVVRRGPELMTEFHDRADFEDILKRFWNEGIPPEAYDLHRRALIHLDERYDPEPHLDIAFSLRFPEWYIGFSNEFVKSISNVDAKMRGRILEAIQRIAVEPNTPSGDTIKPLTDDLRGYWRYRIGGFRLLYFPDISSKRVILVSFTARANAYD